MTAFREAASVRTVRLGCGSGSADDAGTFAGVGAELTRGVVSSCTGVAFGPLLELLCPGLQPRTVQERVPSRRVLRLTSKPRSPEY
jgi:hypothetical protein